MENPFKKVTQFLGGKKTTDDTSKVLPFVVSDKGRIADANERLNRIKELEEKKEEKEMARKSLEAQREGNFLSAVRDAVLKIMEIKKLNTQTNTGIWQQNMKEAIEYYFTKNPVEKNDISTPLIKKENIESAKEKIVNLFNIKPEMQRDSEFFVAAYSAALEIIRKESEGTVRSVDALNAQQIKKVIINYLNDNLSLKNLLYNNNLGKKDYIKNLAKELEEIYKTRLAIEELKRKRA